MYLDKIVADKREEVAAIKSSADMVRMQEMLIDAAPTRPFEASLKRPDGRMGLIAEIKKASPSAGLIQPHFDPVAQANAYQSAGADCLSILTDTKYFQGHLNDLVAARVEVSLPVLRKDFTVDPYQIIEARVAGADAILLIAAVLTKAELEAFSGLARSLNLAALVEVHTEDEMTVALDIGASLIGINSRNLKTFEVDLAVVERVAAMVPKDSDITLVGESGIKTRSDVDRLRSVGTHAVLVGETLMRAGDVDEAVRDLVG